jgi:hypothetical protein
LERVGILGFVGFLVAFIGTAFALVLNWAEVFFAHTLAEVAPELLDEGPSGRFALGFALSFPMFSLGWLLFGVATLRARTYPRIAAILLIVGAVITFVPIPGTGVVLGLAVAWLGFVLFMGRGIAAQPPPRVS